MERGCVDGGFDKCIRARRHLKQQPWIYDGVFGGWYKLDAGNGPIERCGCVCIRPFPHPMPRDYVAGYLRRFHPHQYWIFRNLELIRESVHRHRQRYMPRRIFQRWRCYMDARKSTAASTSHRGRRWCQCCGRNHVCIAFDIHD